MNNTIVFILTSVNDTHMMKRAFEFVENGYKVKLYGFSRSVNINSDYNLPVEILGMMPEKHYFYRLFFMYKALSKIRNDISSDSIMYYFGQDIAMVANRVFHYPYYYEECDLSFSYVGNGFIRSALHWLDRRVIRNSLRTILTSEGFCQYHFGNNRPTNITVIPNRLDPKCQEFSYVPSDSPDMSNLRIGYVGKIRFRSTFEFFKYASKKDNVSLSFYGVEAWFSKDDEQGFDALCADGKIKCFGRFKSPEDLASIYSKIDLTIATYDVDKINPKWAEPNKLYEAIYYETPIIVSSNCYLSDVVEKLGVGFSVKTSDEQSMKSFFESLTLDSIEEKKKACRSLGKDFCLNVNSSLFDIVAADLKNNK